MGDVVVNVNEHTRLVTDDTDPQWIHQLAEPDDDGIPPIMILSDQSNPYIYRKFPLDASFMAKVVGLAESWNTEQIERHLRIVLGLGAGDVVVKTVRDNWQESGTMIVLATQEWREMTGYEGELTERDYSDVQDWWTGDYTVLQVERLQKSVTVALSSKEDLEDEEWIVDDEQPTYSVYGYGKRYDDGLAYVVGEVKGLEPLPVEYIGRVSVIVSGEDGEGAEEVRQALKETVALKMGFSW